MSATSTQNARPGTAHACADPPAYSPPAVANLGTILALTQAKLGPGADGLLRASAVSQP